MIHSTMLNNVDEYSWQACLYTLGKPGFQGLVAAVWWAHCLEIWPETPILPKPLFSWRRLPM